MNAEGTVFQLPPLARDLPAFRTLFPNQVIRADDLARAMVDVVVGGMEVAPSMVFENRDIRALIQSLDPPQAPAKGRK
jgi:hypothetical protein